MITGLNLEQVYNYTLEEDTDNPTIWKLGVIPSDLFALLTEEEGDNIMKAYKYLQVSLRGWENFTIPYQSSEGEIFGRKMNIVPMELLGCIPLQVISKLAKKAIDINRISDDERKN